MIHQAKQKCSGYSNVVFECDDILNYDFEKKWFDNFILFGAIY